jgi:choline kinase
VPQIVVLAAGLGSRLGRPLPKPLTLLRSGTTILDRQWQAFRGQWSDASIAIVVGFKMELIMEEFPDALFVYNQNYDETNTSKSLLKALRLVPPGGVLWLNGDVVFDPQVLGVISPLIDADHSFCCVNTAQVAEEEVKYTVDEQGNIRELAKTVVNGLGEAVGINYVASSDRAGLIRHLEACEEQDYFERGIERAIQEDGQKWQPADISALACVEVDFDADLDRANDIV